MTDKNQTPLGFRIIRTALLTLFCIFAAFFAARLPNAVQDLMQAETLLSAENTAKHYRITRTVASETFCFVFCKDTAFFLYTDAEGAQHLGYYWEQLPLLENEFKLPYVRGRFEEIPADAELADSPSLRAAEQQLNKLPTFPLTLGAKAALLMHLVAED